MLQVLNNRENTSAKKYRHEYKFLCNEAEWTVIQSRIGGLMKPDVNVGEQGFYEIRSIYFDDMYDTCFHANEAGVDPRAKYRIRSYNGSDKNIKLEKKIKQNGKTRKIATLLDRRRFDYIMQGEYSELIHECMTESDDNFLLKEFLTLGLTRRMKPKVVVSYERYPYVEAKGNVRVTFDKNIASGMDFDGFWDENPARVPVLPKGQHLLEVKYDEFLPAYLKESLEIGVLRQTTFSKYYICRKNMKKSFQ